LQPAAELAISLARAHRRNASLEILLKDRSFNLEWEEKIHQFLEREETLTTTICEYQAKLEQSQNRLARYQHVYRTDFRSSSERSERSEEE
jgi:hypothetical protein